MDIVGINPTWELNNPSCEYSYISQNGNVKYIMETNEIPTMAFVP